MRGRLGIMARPRGGEWLAEEVQAWSRARVATVASLLEPDEIRELDLGEEPARCQAAGIDFVTFPIPDRGVPESMLQARRVAGIVVARVNDGHAVAIHCRAGIGRSSLMAGAALVLMGFDAADALARIAVARGLPVPDTDEQRRWLFAFAERPGEDSGCRTRTD